MNDDATTRHLLIDTLKPCAAALLTLETMPEPGMRSITFHALASELRRVRKTEDEALKTLLTYYDKLPTSVTMATARDGQPFTANQVKSAVKSAYRPANLRTYGCNHHVWANCCVDEDLCLFRQQIRTRPSQSREAIQRAFLSQWLPAKHGTGKQLLYNSGLRVYLALEMLEVQRGYEPGSTIYVSHGKLAEAAGMTRSHIGAALTYLHATGLIDYVVGRGRGTASEIRRAIPVPRPPKPTPRPSLDNRLTSKP